MPYLLILFKRQHWQRYRYLLQQVNIRQTLIRACLYLLFVFGLHSWIMVTVEGMRPDEAVWLTLTTVVTVGYGDYAAETLIGRLATIILLYVGGIFVLFHLAADYFEYRSERKMAMLRGRWKWQMKDHVLLLNSPSINRDRYLLGLVEELHRTDRWREAPIQILTREYGDGLPEEFQAAGVVHYHGDATVPEDLEAANAGQAAVIIVLAENAAEKRSDEITFDILHRLGDLKVKGRILAECVRRANRPRLRKAGADSVMRPVRFYPEIVVRAIDSPGSEQILENLFMSEGDDCRSFDVTVRGLTWSSLAAALMSDGLGTAIAYCPIGDDPDQPLRCNPAPDQTVDTDKLYVIVKPDQGVTKKQIGKAIAKLTAKPASARA